ncbi:MAG: DEAD/DEAH box helicase family protein [Myxococcales bacterium]|nr:DEAD/DEAH box helicase family protein [Myxococcales bacterium]
MSSCHTPAKAERPPHPLELNVQWRRFQEIALAQLLSAAMTGDQRMQLVAPPGAGKTLMGLYVALQLGRPILVLSNTRAIAAQWRDTLLNFGLDHSATFGDLDRYVALDLPPEGERMPLLTSVTYQAFTRQRPAKLRQNAKTVRDRLAPSVTKIADRYGQAAPMLVLDECHHLRAWWADVLSDFVEQWPETVILGLTATPPQDAPADERRRFEQLVTEVTHQIPLVGAVREGLLAPFQDLAVFVRPGDDEAEQLAGCERDLSAWLADARDSIGEGADWLPGLQHHVHDRCVSPGRRTLTCTDFLELVDRDADFAIALVRYLQSCDEDWPAEVYPLPEMTFPLTRTDLLALIDDYLIATLQPSESPHAKPRIASLKAALGKLGVQVRKDGLRGQGDAIEDALGRSRARFVAARRIMRRELELLGIDICAAVICDFERSAPGSGRVEDDGGFVPGAIGAFRAVAADPDLADLLPMLATGSERWIPETLLADLRERLGALSVGLVATPVPPIEAGAARGTWLRLSLPGHGGTLLRAMTSLLERDHSHCIVGTRALLGEGWDCRALNTLVDLTASRSHVAVNQLRGRVLRLDPDRPEKVAHIWDVVAVPALHSGATFGLADLERFTQKHRRFYAPALDGTLELGAGHVHPGLRGDPAQLTDAVDAIGAELWAASDARFAARERWRIGTPLEESERCEVQISPLAAPPPEHKRAPQPLSNTPLPAGNSASWSLAWEMRSEALAQRPKWWGGAAAVGVTSLGALALGAPGIVVAGLGLVAAGVWGAGTYRIKAAEGALSRATPSLSEAERTRRVMRVLLKALRHASKKTRDVAVGLDVADDGGMVLRLEQGDARSRERVATAVDQALRGCPAPHYAVEVFARNAPRFGIFAAKERADAFVSVGHVPVPAALGVSRRVAEAWADAWREELGPCELVAVRRDRASDKVPWRDPRTLRWLRSTERRGDTRLVLQ